MSGDHAGAKHISIMNVCADACIISADYLLRDVDALDADYLKDVLK